MRRRLARVASALAVALVGTAACTGNQPPVAATPVPVVATAPDAGAPSTDSGASILETKESRNVARTLSRVSLLRGIKATRPVPGVKLERDQLVARIKDKALREYPPEALRREGQILQLLGFAPATFDYLGETLKLLDAQLEGFYEPNNGTMYLAADLHGQEAQATLAHELVHALQDQKWDLKSRSNYRPGKGDETMALAALAEGDATSVMMDYVMREQGRSALDMPEDMLRELMNSSINVGQIQSVPHVLRTTLIAPYVDGLAFVHALRRHGSWAEVDSAWDRPPISTEQVLHPDKWRANERPLAVATPTGAALPGYKLVDEDSFGELGFALVFEEWMPQAEARKVASGWGGDRSAVYAKDDALALVVHLRYDEGAPQDDAFAERAMISIAASLKNRHKPAIDAGGVLCIERKDTGPLLFARKGRDVVLVAGPAKSSATAWTPEGTCASVKPWADEVLAQR